MEFSSQSWKIKAVYVRLVIEAAEARKIMTKMWVILINSVNASYFGLGQILYLLNRVMWTKIR